jgi:hypothetical protein
MTCHIESELGAYVLNALEIEEAEAIEAHLATCQTCCDEARSLASTASVLALLGPEELEQLDETSREHGRPGRRRRPRSRAARVAVAGAALVGAALTATLVVAGVGGHDHPAQRLSGQAIVRAVGPATHVHAAVAMDPQASGTTLQLTLSGGYPHGWCSLVAHSRDGRSDTVASWWANAHGNASVSGKTTIRADQLTEFDVVTHSGRLLVRIPVPRVTSADLS